MVGVILRNVVRGVLSVAGMQTAKSPRALRSNNDGSAGSASFSENVMSDKTLIVMGVTEDCITSHHGGRALAAHHSDSLGLVDSGNMTEMGVLARLQFADAHEVLGVGSTRNGLPLGSFSRFQNGGQVTIVLHPLLSRDGKR